MESTSCGFNCPFVKTGFCENERECPNYIETWWQEGQTQENKLIKDCSPKRMILQQQLMQTRFEYVQRSLEESRNQIADLCSSFKSLLELSKNVVNDNIKLTGNDYEKLALGNSDNPFSY